MSLLISHRGNVSGMNPRSENSPEYVQLALDQGYHVMVDVWLVGNAHLALGSDHPQYPVTTEFVKNHKVICNARSSETLEVLLHEGAHCFYHKRDSYVLTNGGLIWTYPGKPITTRGIFVMPEWVLPDISVLKMIQCAGICSDRIEVIKIARELFVEHERQADNEHISNSDDKPPPLVYVSDSDFNSDSSEGENEEFSSLSASVAQLD